ncbi:hypothetical protein MG293_001746 [Ovis ammon polii]|uniref:Uncharacterized protein n=1 Tax=Ovis ammon polii TaxID=230172 RepID=A0AAD4YJC4_OVIAM|nr:hypothetical protein MG293_001746 [Ovis ammon polii]
MPTFNSQKSNTPPKMENEQNKTEERLFWFDCCKDKRKKQGQVVTTPRPTAAKYEEIDVRRCNLVLDDHSALLMDYFDRAPQLPYEIRAAARRRYHVQGKEQQLHFAGAALKRYPTSKQSLTSYAEMEVSPKCQLQVETPVGEGNGTPLQYSCLENPMDGEAWSRATTFEELYVRNYTRGASPTPESNADDVMLEFKPMM